MLQMCFFLTSSSLGAPYTVPPSPQPRVPSLLGFFHMPTLYRQVSQTPPADIHSRHCPLPRWHQTQTFLAPYELGDHVLLFQIYLPLGMTSLFSSKKGYISVLPASFVSTILSKPQSTPPQTLAHSWRTWPPHLQFVSPFTQVLCFGSVDKLRTVYTCNIYRQHTRLFFHWGLSRSCLQRPQSDKERIQTYSWPS